MSVELSSGSTVFVSAIAIQMWTLAFAIAGAVFGLFSFGVAQAARMEGPVRAMVARLSSGDAAKARIVLQRGVAGSRIRKRDQAEFDAAALLLVELVTTVEIEGGPLRNYGGIAREGQRLYELVDRFLDVLLPALESGRVSVDLAAECEAANRALARLPKVKRFFIGSATKPPGRQLPVPGTAVASR